MIMRYITMFSMVSLTLTQAFAAEPAASLNLQEKWADVFGGTKAVYHVVVSARDSIQGRLVWRFAVGEGTVARGEQAVAVQPARDARIEIPLDIPPVKEGVVFQGKLTVGLHDGKDEKALALLEKDLWIFPEDPFSLRKEFLKNTGIHLFDPEKKTSKLFEAVKIPFEPIISVDAFSEVKEGLIIVGEGVSFKDYRGLSEMMLQTASRGVPVLCLAPAGGEMTMPGTAESTLPRPKNMYFAGNEMITRLDKRLDAESWPPDRKVVAGGLKLRGERGPVVGEAVNDSGAWPWVEMEFAGKGRVVVCGFGIVEKWKDTPAPRFLLDKMLERMTQKE